MFGSGRHTFCRNSQAGRPGTGNQPKGRQEDRYRTRLPVAYRRGYNRQTSRTPAQHHPTNQPSPLPPHNHAQPGDHGALPGTPPTTTRGLSAEMSATHGACRYHRPSTDHIAQPGTPRRIIACWSSALSSTIIQQPLALLPSHPLILLMQRQYRHIRISRASQKERQSRFNAFSTFCSTRDVQAGRRTFCTMVDRAHRDISVPDR